VVRHLGAKPGAADERARDDLHSVADPRHLPTALFVGQVKGAVTLAGAQGVDHFVWYMQPLITVDPHEADHARALAHACHCSSRVKQ
jgi:hypothetical protein